MCRRHLGATLKKRAGQAFQFQVIGFLDDAFCEDVFAADVFVVSDFCLRRRRDDGRWQAVIFLKTIGQRYATNRASAFT